jgi:hypothetical protein
MVDYLQLCGRLDHALVGLRVLLAFDGVHATNGRFCVLFVVMYATLSVVISLTQHMTRTYSDQPRGHIVGNGGHLRQAGDAAHCPVASLLQQAAEEGLLLLRQGQ